MPRGTKRGTKRITVEVTAETFALLKVLTRTSAMAGGHPRLSDDLKVARVVGYLVHSASDGVRRPGAWERGWVEQAFGPVPDDELEQDTEVTWQQRPRTEVP